MEFLFGISGRAFYFGGNPVHNWRAAVMDVDGRGILGGAGSGLQRLAEFAVVVLVLFEISSEHLSRYPQSII